MTHRCSRGTRRFFSFICWIFAISITASILIELTLMGEAIFGAKSALSDIGAYGSIAVLIGEVVLSMTIAALMMLGYNNHSQFLITKTTGWRFLTPVLFLAFVTILFHGFVLGDDPTKQVMWFVIAAMILAPVVRLWLDFFKVSA